MSDENPDKPTQQAVPGSVATDPPKDWDAIMKEARSKAVDAFVEVERLAYQRGREDERKAVGKFLNKWIAEKIEEAEATAESVTQSLKLPKRTAQEVVLEAIKERPGMRGIEIMEYVIQSGTVLQERTMRTALHRMKTAEPPQILNVDGRWFVPEDAPASTQPELMEDNDPE